MSKLQVDLGDHYNNLKDKINTRKSTKNNTGKTPIKNPLNMFYIDSVSKYKVQDGVQSTERTIVQNVQVPGAKDIKKTINKPSINLQNSVKFNKPGIYMYKPKNAVEDKIIMAAVGAAVLIFSVGLGVSIHWSFKQLIHLNFLLLHETPSFLSRMKVLTPLLPVLQCSFTVHEQCSFQH